MSLRESYQSEIHAEVAAGHGAAMADAQKKNQGPKPVPQGQSFCLS